MFVLNFPSVFKKKSVFDVNMWNVTFWEGSFKFVKFCFPQTMFESSFLVVRNHDTCRWNFLIQLKFLFSINNEKQHFHREWNLFLLVSNQKLSSCLINVSKVVKHLTRINGLLRRNSVAWLDVATPIIDLFFSLLLGFSWFNPNLPFIQLVLPWVCLFCLSFLYCWRFCIVLYCVPLT